MHWSCVRTFASKRAKLKRFMRDKMYSSELLQRAIEALASLPGIGQRTAYRLALHLLNQPPSYTEEIATALLEFRQKIHRCAHCHHISDDEICAICRDPQRDSGTICVVESIRDVFSIESTRSYRGLYHVLGGVISPINDVGPEDLYIEDLVKRVEDHQVREVILALSATIEGDTTMQYLARLLRPHVERISFISRGVAFGGELEYADEWTIAQAIRFRRPIEDFALTPRAEDEE